MKKEYKLVGKVTIPKKKRKEVKSIIQKILYLGGIREKETIEIDGRQCITAGIPKWNAREVIKSTIICLLIRAMKQEGYI